MGKAVSPDISKPRMCVLCMYCQARNGSLSIDPCDKSIGKYVQTNLLLLHCHMGTNPVASK